PVDATGPAEDTGRDPDPDTSGRSEHVTTPTTGPERQHGDTTAVAPRYAVTGELEQQSWETVCGHGYVSGTGGENSNASRPWPARHPRMLPSPWKARVRNGRTPKPIEAQSPRSPISPLPRSSTWTTR